MAVQGTGERTAASLRTRLGIVASVFVAVVIISAGLSALMVRAWSRTVDQRAEMRMTVETVSDLRLAYSDQETGIRGYLLSGDRSSLRPFEDGRRRAATSLGDLAARDVAVAGYDAQIVAVEDAADAWAAAVVEPALAGTPQPDADLAEARFDALRLELDELDELAHVRLDELIERTDDIERTTLGVLIASAVAALGGTLLVSMLFRRWVTQPLARISDAARRLSIDDSVDLPDFEATELQDVTDAIRTLQGSLAGARDRALKAYAGLEQSAVLAVQVRAELADELAAMPDGWAVDSLMIPAEGVVAGDCYDVGLLDQRRAYVVVVDVTGHGARSALDALKAKGQLRAALRSRFAPGAALGWLARESHGDERAALLTAAVVVVDIETGECQYANAGHPPLLVVAGDEIRSHAATGPLVGAFAATWTTGTFTIDPGSTLVVHTDGVTDVLGSDRERFGEARLHDLLRSTDRDAIDVTAALQHAIDEFRAGPQPDDITVVALHHQVQHAASTTTTHEIGTVPA